MKISWRDIAAAVLAIIGGVVVFAKEQSYSWWLIGSWKGALGVVAVLGLAILALYSVDWAENGSPVVLSEILLWTLAGLVTLGSLLATTTEAEFIWSSSLIGLAWATQLSSHVWSSTHRHTTHLANVH